MAIKSIVFQQFVSHNSRSGPIRLLPISACTYIAPATTRPENNYLLHIRHHIVGLFCVVLVVGALSHHVSVPLMIFGGWRRWQVNKGDWLWPTANTEDSIPRHFPSNRLLKSKLFDFFYTVFKLFGTLCYTKNIFLFSLWQQIRSCLHNSDVIVHNKELTHYSPPRSHLHSAQIVTTVNFFCDWQSWTHALN